jgi:hypothetical protein
VKQSNAVPRIIQWAFEVGLAATPAPMMARIGIMRALNRNVEWVFNTVRTNKHWGKRKDQTGRMS